MEIRDYQEKAQRTCASLGDEKLDLCHMTLGIIAEQEEYIQSLIVNDNVNQREELADMCWFVANYCRIRGYEFETLLADSKSFLLVDWEQYAPVLDVFVSRLADYTKKYIAYDKKIDRALEYRTLRGILHGISLQGCGFDFKKDLERNIQKLEARYPEKFTNEAAINRNLDVERKILEG